MSDALTQPPAARPWWAGGLLTSGPFRIGFVATLGVLLALLLGAVIVSLSYAITLIFVAIFISLGLYPVVTRLQARGVSKTGAILIVLSGFLAIVATMWAAMALLRASDRFTAVANSDTDDTNFLAEGLAALSRFFVVEAAASVLGAAGVIFANTFPLLLS